MNEIERHNLRKQMTLDEKIGMVHGSGLFHTEGIPRLNIPPLKMDDGPSGVRQEFNDEWEPIDDKSDYVSWLPSNTCLASTWNPDLAFDFGDVLGAEARGRGKDVILAPGVNIKRSPLCGRNFEYMSEDPYLTDKMAEPLIQGIQHNDVAACVKHFALNNQEHERMTYEAFVDDRSLNELYLPAFHGACLNADSYTLMASYNLYHGSHLCESEELLQHILRDKWHYDGTVISDWGGVHSTKKAAENSLDIEMSVTNNFDDYFFARPLKEAIENGEVAESVLDEKIDRILLLMDRLNMLDGDRNPGSYNSFNHQSRIQKIAEEGIVLLKNDANHLPLEKSKKKIAVIGDNATRTHSAGGGSAEVKCLYDICPLMGIRMLLGGDADVTYVQGYYIDNEEKVIGEVDWQAASLSVDYSQPDNQEEYLNKVLPMQVKLREEAVALAKECDEVIFVGGLNHAFDVEGFDRPHMNLPYAQDELIEALLDVNPNTTIVLIAGSPVDTSKWVDKANSLLQTSYCGMRGGYALARILFGEVNPSGKTPETFPVHLSESPAHSLSVYPGVKEEGSHLKVSYNEGIFVGYRYFEKENKKVTFPFGHGLSYTTFEYDDLRVHVHKRSSKEDVRVTISLSVSNTGSRKGKEVVQVYIGEVNPTVPRPVKELKAFTKVFLEPSEETEVTLQLTKRDFAFYDEATRKFRANSGKYVVYVGSSSADIRLSKEIELPANYTGINNIF